jgi:hypothetical protein
MPLEDRGAYATIIDLIFLYDGPVADNDAVIAGYLRVTSTSGDRYDSA